VEVVFTPDPLGAGPEKALVCDPVGLLLLPPEFEPFAFVPFCCAPEGELPAEFVVPELFIVPGAAFGLREVPAGATWLLLPGVINPDAFVPVVVVTVVPVKPPGFVTVPAVGVPGADVVVVAPGVTPGSAPAGITAPLPSMIKDPPPPRSRTVPPDPGLPVTTPVPPLVMPVTVAAAVAAA
jgi:hypothetical protein